MQHADEFRTFSSACEQLLSSMLTTRPLVEQEEQIVAYYCKEILAKIALAISSTTNPY